VPPSSRRGCSGHREAIGRSPSRQPRARPAVFSAETGYRATVAQALAAHPHPPSQDRLLPRDTRLRAYVEQQLVLKHSPRADQPAAADRLPRNLEMRVSHETIYQSVYVQGEAR